MTIRGTLCRVIQRVGVLRLAVLGAAFVLAAGIAHANAVPVFSTGSNSQTCGTADAHWTYSGGGAATIVSSACGNWFGSWAADTSSSSWIGATSTNPTPAAPYSFSETFSMSGLDPSSAVLSGTWYIDDTGTLSVNGHLLDTETRTFTGVAFSIPTTDLLSGTNTVTVTMTAVDLADDAARVEFTTATANALTSTTPEPSSVILLGSGLLGIVGAIRRRCGRS